MSRISYNENEKKLYIYSIGDAKQNENSLDLSNINWWGRVILKGGANAANRTACKIDRQFDPYTRGEYDRYLIKRTIKAWEETCDIFNDIKNNSCKFSLWIGWAYLKFVIKLIDKFNELLKLSDPEEALKKGMPPEAFFAWQGIPSFEDQKIPIANGDTTDKLQLSYNPQGGITAKIIDSQNNEIPVKIIAISSVKSDNRLSCLHTENERKIFVKKTDLLTIGLDLKGKVPLKQFFIDNNVPNFEDQAIISDEGKIIKLSYDANSSSENGGISLCTLTPDLFMYYHFGKIGVECLENGDVCLSYDWNKKADTFKMRDLRNLVNQSRTAENNNKSEQKGDPINQFFRKQDAVPFKGDYFYSETIQNDDTSQFARISVNVYGNDCVNLEILDKNRSRFSTQNVRIKDNQNSDVVEISGQYWDKNEKRWKNFNIRANRAELLECKHGDETVPNWPTTIKLVNFLRRNDVLPPNWQIRTLSATQLDGPNDKENNKEVQIEINSNGDVHVEDKTLKNINLSRDESCSDGEAIITGSDGGYSYRYKVRIDDLLGKDDNE